MIVIDIARHELRRLYHGPLLWVLMALIQFFLSITFFTLVDHYQEAQSSFVNLGITITVVVRTLQSAGLLLLLVTPFLTMRLISDERRSGTLILLLSAPVSIAKIIIGKYLAIMACFLLILSMISLMPLSLTLGTRLDFGMLASGMVGLLLLSSSLSAIGLFASTLTRQPAVAAALTFALTMLFWVVHILSNTDNEILAAVINYLSMQRHLNHLLSGMFASVDIIYYVLISAMFILLSMLRLDAIRSLE